MTIAIAWVATHWNGREELFLAADSRTRGVRVLDLSPKVLILPRSDCAICFAGDTSATYPLMLQVAAAIAAHEPARERHLDVADLKFHLLHVLTDIIARVKDAVEPLNPIDVQFILGGYSCRSKSFRIWTVYWETSSKTFRARSSVSFHKRLNTIAFIGDCARRYRANLAQTLNENGDRAVKFEPLMLLAKLLRKSTIRDSFGGAPQIVRVTPHMITRPLCVLWGSCKRRYLFGRELFEYENCDFWSIDPDTGKLHAPRHFKSAQQS